MMQFFYGEARSGWEVGTWPKSTVSIYWKLPLVDRSIAALEIVWLIEL